MLKKSISPKNKFSIFFRHVEMKNLTWKSFGYLFEALKNDLEFF